MKFQPKALMVAIALTFAETGHTAALVSANTNKPFAVSGKKDIFESGYGRRIAGDGKGRFIHVWTDGSNVYARYSRNGAVDGAAVTLGTINNGFNPALSVAMNSAGNAAVCWRSYSIVCQRIPADTTAPLPEALVLNAFGAPVVALDGNDTMLLGWQEQNHVFAQRFSATNEAQAPLDIASVANEDSLDLATTSSGDAVIVWQDGGIFAKRLSSTDQIGEAIRIDTSPADDASFAGDNQTTTYTVQAPAVAMNESGQFIVAWQRNKTAVTRKQVLGSNKDSASNSSGIFAQRFDSADTKLNATGDLAVQFKDKFAAILPQVALDTSGNFLVTWQDQVAKKVCQSYAGVKYCDEQLKSSSVFVRKYEKTSNALAAVTVVAKTSASSEFNDNPSVAIDDNGNYQIAWTATDQIKRVSSYQGQTYSYDEPLSSLITARYYPAKTK